MTPINLHPDRLFPADPATRDLARAALRHGEGPADRQPARAHRSALVRRRRAVSRSASQLLIVPDHYIFRMLYSQGVALEDLGVPRRDGGAGRDRRAQDLAAASPRTITCSAARRRASGSTTSFATMFGMNERLSAANADRYLRRASPSAWRAGLSPARAVRALQHRGDRHHRGRRSIRSAMHHRTIRDSRLEGPRRHRLPSGSGRRSGFRRLRATIVDAVRRDHRRRHAATGRAISPRIARGAPSS